jgi:hypothetical protein
MTRAQYRRSLRRKAGILIFCLYLLAQASVGWQWLSATLILQNPQKIEARVTRSRPPGPKETLGSVSYSYTVDGKTYQGSFESGGLEVGAPVPIYCNPRYAWLSSYKEPGPEREGAQAWMLVLTFVYAMMAAVVLGVVSLVSPPRGAIDPSSP